MHTHARAHIKILQTQNTIIDEYQVYDITQLMR